MIFIRLNKFIYASWCYCILLVAAMRFLKPTNEQTAETQKLKGNSKKIAPVAIIIIIITGTGIAYWLLAPHISWLFVGAYGNY